ncbi:MAG: hypothetical protein ACJA2W_001339 [Planctomycetota bacterium]|jgi:hypothetical protein
MNVSTADSLRLVPWLLNANPPGIRGNALRSFTIVMVVLAFVLAREHEVVAGYTTPALERPAMIAVWLPLFVGFMLANGFAQVRSIPAMVLLPAFARKARRASALLFAGCVLLAGAMALFTGVGLLAALSVAAFAYGLGARAFSAKTDHTPRAFWFLATVTVVLNGGTILAWADGKPWLAALLATAGLVDQFLAFRNAGPATGASLAGAIYPHGVTPRGRMRESASLASGDSRLRAALGYLRRCRGARFFIRVTVSATLVLGVVMAASSGMIWMLEGSEVPEGGLLKGMADSLWRRPGTVDEPRGFFASSSLIYYPLTLLSMGTLVQESEQGYLPFSRKALGYTAFRRFLTTALAAVCVLTVIGVCYAMLALMASGAPRSGRIPTFLFLLPYVLTALPWAGVAAVAGGEQIPFQSGSLSKILGNYRAVIALSVSLSIILCSLFIGADIETRAEGGWLQYPWVWGVALVLIAAGVRQLRRSFDRFYSQIPLVPEA